jgi:hypothetical protein
MGFTITVVKYLERKNAIKSVMMIKSKMKTHSFWKAFSRIFSWLVFIVRSLAINVNTEAATASEAGIMFSCKILSASTFFDNTL